MIIFLGVDVSFLVEGYFLLEFLFLAGIMGALTYNLADIIYEHIEQDSYTGADEAVYIHEV